VPNQPTKPGSARKQTGSEQRSSSHEGRSSSSSGPSSSGRTATAAGGTPSAPISSEPSGRSAESLGTLGRYRLLGRIGEGGMAEVYRAVIMGPEGFERELVLKRILPRLSASGDFKTMFVREAKICAQMLHPNIIQIYEFGQADGGYFIAMESVQGVTLRELLTTLRKDERGIPHMIAADVCRQICVGLDYAHTLRGADGEPLEIVHQDISPTNIMLSFTGTVKILDFGIARAAEFAEEEAKKGMIKGKVSYLSPEQIYVRPFDARADVFALGVVFHEMLTGRRLFQSRNDITKMRELLAAPILPPSAIDAMVPRELDRIVMKSLEIDPKDRYQSSADMAADLERTLIAARYSSRDLPKMLRDLYQSGDEPLVVVEAGEDKENLERTIAITSTTTLPAPDQTMTVRHKEETQMRMDGVLRAERARLRRVRWRSRLLVMFVVLLIAGALGGVALVAKKYGPDLVKRATTSTPPPMPVMKNQEADAPTAKKASPPAATKAPPAKKHGERSKKKGRAAAAPSDPAAAPAPSGDAPLPPSPE
jgi:serine/threonine protein kinase